MPGKPPELLITTAPLAGDHLRRRAVLHRHAIEQAITDGKWSPVMVGAHPPRSACCLHGGRRLPAPYRNFIMCSRRIGSTGLLCVPSSAGRAGTQVLPGLVRG